jgi:hypothetical protein
MIRGKRGVMMAGKPATVTGRIALNKRTLRIGYQTYQLRNIARVQVIALGRLRKPHIFLSSLAWASAIVLILILGAIAALFVIAVGVIALIFISGMVRRSPPILYGLLLETTGDPQTVLASPDFAELNRLADIIVGAIEDPPTSELIVPITNVIYGDQINQAGGHHNVIKKAS